MENIISMIRDANPERNNKTLLRRIFKLTEEFGEHAEAYLNVTSKNNGKGKSWDDVREEIADTLIVAVDVALTPANDGESGEAVENILKQLTYSDHSYDRYELSMINASVAIGQLANSVSQDRQDILPVVGLVETITNMALTAMPDQANLDKTELLSNLEHLVDTKLDKWKANRLTGMNASDS